MRIVYVAGPFTSTDSWTREQNTRKAEDLGFLVAQAGAMPLIPHANTRFFDGLKTPEFWYEGTLELLRRCDAIAIVHGFETSKGTKREIEEAGKLSVPIFFPHERPKLVAWIKKNSR